MVRLLKQSKEFEMRLNTFSRMGVVAGVLLLIMGCASEPAVDKRAEARNADGLYPVTGTSMDSVFIDIDANLKDYRKVYIAPLNTSHVEVDYTAESREWRSRDWDLTEADRQALENMFTKAVDKEFQVAGVALVDQPAEGVLVVEPELKKLEPNAPKDAYPQRTASNRYYTEGAGRVTLGLTFKDGTSGKVIGTAVDKRDAGTQWRENTAISNRWEVQRLFNRWIMILDHSLEPVATQ